MTFRVQLIVEGCFWKLFRFLLLVLKCRQRKWTQQFSHQCCTEVSPHSTVFFLYIWKILGSQGHIEIDSNSLQGYSFLKCPLLTWHGLDEFSASLKINCALPHFPSAWNGFSSTIKAPLSPHLSTLGRFYAKTQRSVPSEPSERNRQKFGEGIPQRCFFLLFSSSFSLLFFFFFLSFFLSFLFSFFFFFFIRFTLIQ